MAQQIDLSSFDTRQQFESQGKTYTHFALSALDQSEFGPISRFPYSLRVLLENLLRYSHQGLVDRDDLLALLSWRPEATPQRGIPFMPSRVVLQDFTGVPALVDLAALRSAVARNGGDPADMNPFIPVDLVIDHSIQVDRYGNNEAVAFNVQREMERNVERYVMLHWGQKAFKNFRVVPPGTGIVHQVNLEYLASVAQTGNLDGQDIVYPDSVLGTDSHTTMINGLGVMGWGVGGIEAEAVLLAQPYTLQIPDVVGMRLSGTLPAGTTATDLVLTITRFLREKGVVGRFVEYFGPALQTLSLPDRATIANMAPEYGATMGFFPVDEVTVRFLQNSGRDPQLVQLVEDYFKAAGMFYTPDAPEPEYSTTYEIDLATVKPALSGPRRPQELLLLSEVSPDFNKQFSGQLSEKEESIDAGNMDGCPTCGTKPVECSLKLGDKDCLTDGAVVIAAITSCTNTSNPDVMIGAGLLARKAAALGLKTKPWVKTSMAPGSRVVTQYLEKSGLLTDMEALGFNVVGYGCTTCIGNSGPLDDQVAKTINEKNLITASVLSGNRNFEARIHPLIQANYLASPLLVIAYALVGSININMDADPLGKDKDGNPVYLKDIWPTREEIDDVVSSAVTPDLFINSYASVFDGDENWQNLHGGDSSLFPWDPESSYIREPSFFVDLPVEPEPISDIDNARILALFGDTITTDHISPAGAIGPDSPAGRYLQDQGVKPEDFNSFGSRRGNHEVMMRGTFGNIRINNTMVEGIGGYTRLMPEDQEMSIYDAAMAYKQKNVPLVVLAGKDYGTGSSRDWAAKGTKLLGVQAVIAVSFERIHRSNLIGMGVLPLQFAEESSAESLGITGSETISIIGLNQEITPCCTVDVLVNKADGSTFEFPATVRLDNDMEIDYYRHGGILQKVLRQILSKH
ncbi:aconitate hydratase AcnA [Desulfogranum japonicum]|uniref:aconitate hydratase AcnA n=1 Tax=Desulfogranum japonicum TaxID=231447 RepID=UPI0004142F43|nr:aconitate hydratase AcnA [Desulfogranum japonicum]